ncbi:MAG: DUF2147 domain-containing protein [Alphaproteobacteria bacterium]|nr:DUF2147 domain-containing protein [Alphaproteobacteria bacterium]MBM3654197.1 DUF2147 domain-containing protein [Alphaproteobacteria bacterium]
MRKACLRVAVAIALCAPTAANAVDAIYGVWVREGHPDDKLEFYDCTGKLCAKGIEPMPDGSPPPVVLKNAAKTTPNHWEGDINDPESGKTYIGKIALDSPTSLTMTGCLVAFLCQSETWTRVSGPTKPAADAKPSGQEPAAKAAAPASEAKEPVAKEPVAKEPIAKEPATKETPKPAAKEAPKPTAKPAKPAKGKAPAPAAETE